MRVTVAQYKGVFRVSKQRLLELHSDFKKQVRALVPSWLLVRCCGKSVGDVETGLFYGGEDAVLQISSQNSEHSFVSV